MVSVKWDAGTGISNSYRMVEEAAQDLEVLDVVGGAPPGIGIDDSDVVPQVEPPSPEETIASLYKSRKLQLGVRVVRGRSWKSGASDGGLGCVGLVVQSKRPDELQEGDVDVSNIIAHELVCAF